MRRLGRILRRAADRTVWRKRRFDPVCGRSFPRFKDGPRARPEAYCPECGSAERHRVLWLYLRDRVGVRPMRILHVAPEAGIQSRLRRLDDVDYVSTDLEPGAAMVTADLTRLPFDAASFDLVLCNHVLEHIPDDVAAMREVHRVLRPEGTAIMQHPIDPDRAETFEDESITDPAERERVYGQSDHIRIYGRDFEARLAAAGFGHVETVKYTEQLPAAEVRRMGLEQHPSNTPGLDLEADRIYVLRR